MLFSLAYFSPIEHRLKADENFAASATTTQLTAPEAVNIEFKTGVAPNTLLLASVRWVNWREFVFDPEFLPFEVANFEDDVYTYQLGIARRFSAQWAGVIDYRYEPSQGTNSLFSPVDGYRSLALSTIYTFPKQVKLAVGVAYTVAAGASADIVPGHRIDFTDAKSLATGVKLSVPF